MKIVMVDPGSYTAHYNANLCHALAGRGHGVCLDTSEFLFEPVSPLPGYQVRYLFYRLFGRVPALKRWPPLRQGVKAALYPLEMGRWAGIVAGERPDVVHLQWSLLPLWDARLYARLQRRGVRLIYTVHDVLPLPSSPWNWAGYGRLYRQADQVIVHAERSRERLIEDFGVRPEQIQVVPMGGPGAYAKGPMDQREARRRLDLPQDAACLLFIGMIKRYKGLDLLLDALALARQQRPDLYLIIAGEPMQPWEPFAVQIQRLGLQEAIRLHLGFVPSEEMDLYFGACDLVALPYREIYQSGVTLAAYTFARPVLATRVGGLPELVQEGTTGFLAPPHDPVALAEALVAATADREKLRAMRSSALAVARGPNSWEHIAQLHESIYQCS